MNTRKTQNRAATAARTLALALLAVNLASTLVAKDVNYAGGSLSSGATAPGDNILVAIGTNTTTYTYTYTAPDGTTVTGTKALGEPALRSGSNDAITLSAATAGGGITIKPATGEGAVWAVLDGNVADTAASRRRLIAVNEPTSGSASTYVINLNGVVIQNGYAGNNSTGGGMQMGSGSSSTPNATLRGDAIFYNNYAGRNAGALQAGSTGMTFDGNFIFDSNKAGTADGSTPNATAGHGGGIMFGATAGTTLDFVFNRNAIFLNNMTLGTGNGGAIVGTNSSATNERDIIFKGNAIFDGNIAGASALGDNGKGFSALATTGNGGAIYVTSGIAVTFYDSAAFTKNVAAGYGGVMYVRDRDITFGDESGRTYAGQRAFSFTRNVSVTSAQNNGGAILLDNSIWASGAAESTQPRGAVIFDATNSKVDFTGNATNGSGGAIHVNGGGVYLYNGAFTFKGNQAASSGGAIANSAIAATGGNRLPAGKTHRIEVKTSATFDSNVTKRDGGAIWGNNTNLDYSMYFGTDTADSSIVFSNNVAAGAGGAIYVTQAATQTAPALVFKAANGDITFTGNRQGATVSGNLDALAIYNNSGNSTLGYFEVADATGNANDIYFGASGMTINLDAAAGRTISFDGGFAGSSASNTLNVNKTGAGTLIFGRQARTAPGTNTNNLKTTTKVDGGALMLANGALYGSGAGAITVADGAAIGGNGAYKEAVTIKGGANINVGALNSATPETLAFDNTVTLGETGKTNRIYFDLLGSRGDTGTYDQLKVNNTLTATGTQIYDVIGIGTGTYTLLTANALNIASSTYALQSNGAALTSRYSGELTQSGNTIILSSSMQNFAVRWTGAGGNLWQDNVGTNWSTTADANEKYFRNGDSITFGDTTSGTIAVAAAGVEAAGITVDAAGGQTYTFAGGSIVTSTLANDTTLAAASGKLAKIGTGTLAFANAANPFADGIDLAAGAIVFSDGAQLGAGAGAAIRVTGNATLAPAATASGTVTLATNLAINPGVTATLDTQASVLALSGGTLSGAGNITKTGANDLVFNHASAAYSGAARITQGRFLLGDNATFGGSVTLDTGATLGGNGTITGAVTASPGSILRPNSSGASAPKTLTLGGLALNSGTLVLGLYSGSTGSYLNSDHINVAGAAAFSGTNIIDINGSAQNGTYYLGQNLSVLFTGYSGTTIVTLNGDSQIPGARQGASLSNSGNDLLLVYTADLSRNMSWTGTATGNWNISDNNWTDGGTTIKFGSGDHVTFGNAGAARPTVNIAGSGQQFVSDLTVTGTVNYTITGQGINAAAANMVLGSALTPTGKLYKSGAGTLTLANAANIFSGGIDISGGVIAFNDAAQLATGPAAGISFTATGGTLRPNADGMTLANPIAIAPAAATGAFDTDGHSLTLAGAITGAGTLAKIGSGTLTLATDSSSFAGGARVETGALLLATGAKLGGAVNINSGALFGGAGQAAAVIAASGATLQVGYAGTDNADALTLASLTLSNGSTLTGAGSLTGAITIGAAAGDLVTANIAESMNLTIAGAATGAGSIEKTGAGTLIYNSAAAIGYTGPTTITEGVLALRNITGADATALAKTFNLAGGWLDLSDTAYVSDGSAANDWRNIVLNYTGATGGVISSNDKLTLHSGTYAYQIGDTGKTGVFVVVDPGAGNSTTLTQSSKYVGYTRIDSGTLNFSGDSQLGDVAAAREVILNGGALRATLTSAGASNSINSKRKIELRAAGAVSVDTGVDLTVGGLTENGGAFAFTKTGSGALILTGASTRTGAITLREGILHVGNSTALGTTAAVLTIDGPGAAFGFSANNLNVANNINLGANMLRINTIGNTATYSGTLGGAGGIIKTSSNLTNPASITNSGTNALVLTGQNTYSGTTIVASGILRAGGANTLSPNSPVYISNFQGTAPGSSTIVYPRPILDLGGFNQATRDIENNGFVNMRGATLTLGGGQGTFANNGILILGAGAATVSSGTYTYDMSYATGTNARVPVMLPGARAIINGNLVGGPAMIGVITSGVGVSGGVLNTGKPSVIVVSVGLDAAGRITAIDKLQVNGDITGQNRVNFSLVQNGVVLMPTGTMTVSSSGTNAYLLPVRVPSIASLVDSLGGDPIFTASGNIAPDAFVKATYPYQIFDNDGYELIPSIDGQNVYLGSTFIAEVPAVVGIDAAALFIGKATAESISQRLSSLRATNVEHVDEHSFDLWFNGLQRFDKLRGTALYTGAKSNTQGVQVGGDYADFDSTRRVVFGAFMDYTKGDIDYPNHTATRSEIYGIGFYGSYQRQAWYLDLMVRGSKDDYFVDVPNTPALKITGVSWGGSAETGYTIDAGYGFFVQPQLQLGFQRHDINSSRDALGRNYVMDTIKSFTARAGVQVMHPITLRSGNHVTPYLRLSLEHEMAASTRLTIGRTTIENDLTGEIGILNGGIMWALTERLNIAADASAHFGHKYLGYSFNLGARYFW